MPEPHPFPDRSRQVRWSAVGSRIDLFGRGHFLVLSDPFQPKNHITQRFDFSHSRRTGSIGNSMPSFCTRCCASSSMSSCPSWSAAEAAVELVHGVSHCREASKRSIACRSRADRAGIGEPEGHSSSRSLHRCRDRTACTIPEKADETPRLTCDLSPGIVSETSRKL